MRIFFYFHVAFCAHCFVEIMLLMASIKIYCLECFGGMQCALALLSASNLAVQINLK